MLDTLDVLDLGQYSQVMAQVQLEPVKMRGFASDLFLVGFGLCEPRLLKMLHIPRVSYESFIVAPHKALKFVDTLSDGICLVEDVDGERAFLLDAGMFSDLFVG